MGWEELIEALEGLETEREYDGYFCSVKDAVIILVLGSLCGLRNVKRIHEWAAAGHVREFLRKEFGIGRIPCYWWLLTLLAIVTPDSLNRCMARWVSEIAPGLADRIREEEKGSKGKPLTLAFDGKEIRSTERMDAYAEPLHIVSVHIGEFKMSMAQETVAGKSNEIPAVQKLIRCLEIEGYMVVADALNCQIETARAAIDRKADYFLSAKDNQLALKADIEEYVRDEKLRSRMDSVSTRERGHGRREVRSAFTTDDVSWKPGGREWSHLKSIGAVHTQFGTKKGRSEEWHYYISSRNLTAEELLHNARCEWSVETMHWLLDVHFGEDGCRVQTKTAQQNLNMVRKFSLNIITGFKRSSSSKDAMTTLMFKSLMNPAHILTVLGKN